MISTPAQAGDNQKGPAFLAGLCSHRAAKAFDQPRPGLTSSSTCASADSFEESMCGSKVTARSQPSTRPWEASAFQTVLRPSSLIGPPTQITRFGEAWALLA
jgi:hypothetical protein